MGCDEGFVGGSGGFCGGEDAVGGLEGAVERGDALGGFLDGVVGEIDVVSVVCGEEEVAQGFGMDFLCDIPDGPEIFEGMAHFFAVDFNHSDVHPMAGEVAVLSAFCLCDFVFVVWEDEVATAAVDVKRGGEVFCAHA